ncbi:unnamed protein product [Soboliphyme baturini]|uniref:DUF3553 domain-containing protein n=1 Tax=Soboliphyme baturini TaxID=241478 RepID=A0A183IJV6_9BILA|nr:unnamed protein product [Soboliphyme baturini]
MTFDGRFVRPFGVMQTEHVCWYPKDGELCLSRTKPEETLVEVRDGVDVQITRHICVYGKKTDRAI